VIKDEKENYAIQEQHKEEGMAIFSQGAGIGNADSWMSAQSFGGRDNTVNVEIRLTPQGTFKYKAQKI
jgi:hypothetical protein